MSLILLGKLVAVVVSSLLTGWKLHKRSLESKEISRRRLEDIIHDAVHAVEQAAIVRQKTSRPPVLSSEKLSDAYNMIEASLGGKKGLTKLLSKAGLDPAWLGPRIEATVKTWTK